MDRKTSFLWPMGIFFLTTQAMVFRHEKEASIQWKKLSTENEMSNWRNVRKLDPNNAFLFFLSFTESSDQNFKGSHGLQQLPTKTKKFDR